MRERSRVRSTLRIAYLNTRNGPRRTEDTTRCPPASRIATHSHAGAWRDTPANMSPAVEQWAGAARLLFGLRREATDRYNGPR